MNIKDHFCLSRHLLPAIALNPTRQNWICSHISNRQYTEFQISNFWSHRSLGRKLRFFSPLGFDVGTNSDHKTPQNKLYSVRALKRYLNEKYLTHSRVMTTISKFSPQIFETYFNYVCKRPKVSTNLIMYGKWQTFSKPNYVFKTVKVIPKPSYLCKASKIIPKLNYVCKTAKIIPKSN